MTYNSHLSRAEIFVAAACVGAHANSTEGFRQRDVKFLIELFSNWIETVLHQDTLLVQNTQVQRYLEGLVTEGYSRRLTRGTHPQYRLTRTGLLELVSRMVDRPNYETSGHFFFLLYFVKSYGPRIADLVKSEGKQFPYALKLELEGLLDVSALLKRQLDSSARELKKLERRIDDARKTSQFARDGKKAGHSTLEITKEAEKRFPYELNSQRPLQELIASIPEAFRLWELEEGNMRRVVDIWEPSKAVLEAYIKELKRLESELR